MSDVERCIRDAEGRICAWEVGMSEEAIEEFLEKYPGTYRSASIADENGWYR